MATAAIVLKTAVAVIAIFDHRSYLHISLVASTDVAASMAMTTKNKRASRLRPTLANSFSIGIINYPWF